MKSAALPVMSVLEVICFLLVFAFAVHTLDVSSPLIRLYEGWLAVLSLDPICLCS